MSNWLYRVKHVYETFMSNGLWNLIRPDSRNLLDADSLEDFNRINSEFPFKSLIWSQNYLDSTKLIKFLILLIEQIFYM